MDQGAANFPSGSLNQKAFLFEKHIYYLYWKYEKYEILTLVLCVIRSHVNT